MACGLKKRSSAVTVGGLSIADFTAMSVTEALRFLQDLTPSLSPMQTMIAGQILKEIRDRLRFLESVGLQYLSLSRSAGSLSGGEAQRIRLATQIGSSLMGVLYILDEPSIGLHQRDNAKLLRTLRNLRDLGNTLIVVEHDEETIRAADYILDIGPGAGIHGGEVVAKGSVEDLCACPRSVTGQYLSGRARIPVPTRRRTGNGHFLTIRGAAENNLKHIDVSIPLGAFTCVTGVSGSGKSSLVNEVLYKTLAAELNRVKVRPGRCDGIDGLQYVDKVIAIDQSPIGRTPRSNNPPPTPVSFPISATCLPARRTPPCAASDPALLLQRPGRPLRGLRRRRAHQNRNAFSAGHLRPLRGLQRQALQPRDPGGAL
jgi:excinuclease ABC subunit A